MALYNKKIGLGVTIIAICLSFSGCAEQERLVVVPDGMNSSEPIRVVDEQVYVPSAQPAVIEHEIRRADLTVVGDIMFHEYQLQRSYDSSTGLFDFSDQFVDVEPYLSAADYTMGNLETTFAGVRNRSGNIAGYTGYPCFNTPDAGGQNIKDVGFDLVTTANNHAMDSNEEGVRRTLDVLDGLGIEHVGTYRTAQEQQEIKIIEVEGISLAVISCTYDLNGFILPQEAPYLVNTLNSYKAEKQEAICALVRKAETMNPDFVIVMPHFGSEYVEEPNSYQRTFVDQLFSAGADLILGSHPHVLQPIEVRQITRPDGTIEQGLVIYSLGNFISSQKAEKGMNKDLGVIMNLELEKIDDLPARVKAISLVPTYTYWSDSVIGILPVDETLDKIAAGTKAMPSYDRARLEFAQSYSIDHLMSYLPDKTFSFENYKYRISLED